MNIYDMVVFLLGMSGILLGIIAVLTFAVMAGTAIMAIMELLLRLCRNIMED